MLDKSDKITENYVRISFVSYFSFFFGIFFIQFLFNIFLNHLSRAG